MRGVKFIVPAIILIGVVIFQSLFIVQEISQAIVLQFGDPKKIVTKAGLNFKLPFIQNVVYLDKRILNLIGDIYDGNNYSQLPWLKMLSVLVKNPDLLPMAGKLLKIKSSLKVTETYGW